MFADNEILPKIRFNVSAIDLCNMLKDDGHQVLLVNFRVIFGIYAPCSNAYSLMVGTPGKIIDLFDPDFVHIFTGGLLGILARRACINRKLRFTTTHIGNNILLPNFVYQYYSKWFHSKSQKVLSKELSVDFIDNLVLAK